jgi:DNA-directed RNA polymerase specialized sigma subunit
MTILLEELLTRYRNAVNGNKIPARNAVVEHLVPWLKRQVMVFARKNGGDVDDLWDASVVTLMHAVEKHPHAKCFSAYISRACYYAMLRVAKKRKLDRLPEHYDQCAPQSWTPERFAEHIAPLDHRERLVVVAHLWLELPFRQVAVMVGCCELTAGRIYRNAIAKLRRRQAAPSL